MTPCSVDFLYVGLLTSLVIFLLSICIPQMWVWFSSKFLQYTAWDGEDRFFELFKFLMVTSETTALILIIILFSRWAFSFFG